MDSRKSLVDMLRKEHCFWSYADASVDDVPDDILIEKTLVYLDMPEIETLFSIFPTKKIKKVWLDCLVPQGEYLHVLNRFFAWYLFDIKQPDAYLKAMETRRLNKLFA